MYKLNEIVPVQLGNEKKLPEKKGKTHGLKLAMRIKRENGSEVLIYNGINNYILQAILKELLSNAL
ncbi:hypothetical protein [Enterococcus faecium]|uniref:hypothetical protein n=1 Tax=Enterococcus faecium TaxID=1352 RepID=UPI0039C71A0A